MAKKINIKVTCNLYGNYRGRLTGHLSQELGCSEFDALMWLSETLYAHPTAVLSDKSHFMMSEVEKFRARLSK